MNCFGFYFSVCPERDGGVIASVAPVILFVGPTSRRRSASAVLSIRMRRSRTTFQQLAIALASRPTPSRFVSEFPSLSTNTPEREHLRAAGRRISAARPQRFGATTGYIGSAG